MSLPLRRLALMVVATALIAGSQSLAQTKQSKAIEPFDVASIKPHDPNDLHNGMRFGPTVSVTGMTLKNLLFVIQHLREYQLSGGPKWFGSDKYDIVARTPPGSPQVRGAELMRVSEARLFRLLETRCMLKTHHESKVEPIYTLSVAKAGLKMPLVTPATEARAKGSVVPWSIFVSDLSYRLDRPLIDKTGLNGGNVYDVYLKYTTDDGKPAGMGTGRLDMNDPLAEPGPSIFTALQEQLGLKLDAEKGPVDVLVIDSVMRPTEN